MSYLLGLARRYEVALLPGFVDAPTGSSSESSSKKGSSSSSFLAAVRAFGTVQAERGGGCFCTGETPCGAAPTHCATGQAMC